MELAGIAVKFVKKEEFVRHIPFLTEMYLCVAKGSGVVMKAENSYCTNFYSCHERYFCLVRGIRVVIKAGGRKRELRQKASIPGRGFFFSFHFYQWTEWNVKVDKS